MDKTEKNTQTAWHALEIGEVLRDLQVHEDGLTALERFPGVCTNMGRINYRRRRVPAFGPHYGIN
jgi:hypothetical protein